MVFNNGFPVTYQPMQQAQPMYPPMPQQNVQNLITWVQGEAGAKSFLTSPNSIVPLWDSETKTIYIKSTDANGRPTMQILDYTIRGEETKASNPLDENVPYVTKADLDTYVTTADLEELKDYINRQINAIRSNINNPNNSSYSGRKERNNG